MVSSPTTGQVYSEPAYINNQFQHLHIAPETVKPTQSRVLYILTTDFHTEPAHLPKGIAVAHCTEPPLLIIDLPHPAHDRELATATFLMSDKPLIALAH